MNHLDQINNLKVKITTLLDESITGVVYACSSSHSVLALRVSSNTGKNIQNQKAETYRFFNAQFIKSMQLISPLPKKQGKNTNQNLAPIYPISIKEIEAKLEKSLQPPNGNPKQARPNAPPIAIRLFETFSKKYGLKNVQWKGSDIILFNEIKSSKPYTLSKGNLTELTKGSKYLPDVQKTLKEIWLELDNEKRGG